MTNNSSTDTNQLSKAPAFPDPVLTYSIIDDMLIVRQVNDQWECLIGAIEPGTPLNESLPDRLSEAINTDRMMADDSIETTIEWNQKEGNEKEFLVRITPPTGPSETGYMILTNISDHLHELQDLRAQRDRLEEFASILSHNLRNPLDVAKARITAAQETGEDVHFEKAKEALDRMEEIITNVLVLARQGRVIDETEPVELETIIRDAWNSIAVESAELLVEGPLPTIESDTTRLQELFENLFRNAIEHSDEDVTVEVGMFNSTPIHSEEGHETSSSIGFYVADNGPGIPIEDRNQVFELGYSTETSTGLGLSIVQRIADAHGWDIRVTASDAGGTRIECTGINRID